MKTNRLDNQLAAANQKEVLVRGVNGVGKYARNIAAGSSKERGRMDISCWQPLGRQGRPKKSMSVSAEQKLGEGAGRHGI